MPKCSLIHVNLMVVSSFQCFVTKEVNLLETTPFHMRERVCLVPTNWEKIEADLTTNGALNSKVWEFLVDRCDHILADVVHIVVFIESNSLFLTAVATNRRHIQHPVAEFNEGASGKSKSYPNHTNKQHT
jgi:hypothetical protein